MTATPTSAHQIRENRDSQENPPPSGSAPPAISIVENNVENYVPFPNDVYLGALLQFSTMHLWEYDVSNDQIRQIAPRHCLLEQKPGKFANLLGLVHPDDRAGLQGLIEQAVRDRTGYEVELRMRDYNGVYNWVKARAKVFPTPDGKGVRIIGASEFVTEKKQAEELIAHQRAQILGQARLAALADMAAGLAHEINNPLMIVLGNLHRLRREVSAPGASPESLGEVCDKIERSVDRVAKIVKAMRSFSGGGKARDHVLQPVRDLIGDVALLCQERFHDRKIQVEIPELPDASVKIPCDPAEIRQALYQLIINASDALEETENRWIKIGYQERADRIEIEVSDSGPGVSHGQAERIFEPFFTTKEIGRGMGIGLSWARGIAREHGGDLILDTASDNTRFVLKLPFEVPQATAAGLQAHT